MHELHYYSNCSAEGKSLAINFNHMYIFKASHQHNILCKWHVNMPTPGHPSATDEAWYWQKRILHTGRLSFLTSRPVWYMAVYSQECCGWLNHAHMYTCHYYNVGPLVYDCPVLFQWIVLNLWYIQPPGRKYLQPLLPYISPLKNNISSFSVECTFVYIMLYCWCIVIESWHGLSIFLHVS